MKPEATLSFAPDHPAFAGHFPGFPIVPGVMLLDAVVHLLETASGHAVSEIPSAKFLRPVAPGQAVTLSCASGPGRRRFEIASGGEAVVSGQLTTAEP